MRGSTVALVLLAACSGPTKPEKIRWLASPHFNEREPGTSIDAIVVHTTEGTYDQAIRWFQNPESEVSAHYVISPTGEITQMVPLEKRAWHATYYNTRSIGIEVAGHAAQPDTWTPANLEALTALTAWLCDRYRVPVVHPTQKAGSKEEPLNVAGIVAHGQIQPWNRTDPGPHFPWERFINDVRDRQ